MDLITFIGSIAIISIAGFLFVGLFALFLKTVEEICKTDYEKRCESEKIRK